MRIKKITLPPQAMRLNFEGLEATRFWLRALNLQKQIEAGVSMFARIPVEHDTVSSPIIFEYKVEGWGTFLTAMMIDVDRLGLCGGLGSIFFASPERLEEATKARDELADVILEMIHKRKIPGATIIIEPGKEAGRPE